MFFTDLRMLFSPDLSRNRQCLNDPVMPVHQSIYGALVKTIIANQQQPPQSMSPNPTSPNTEEPILPKEKRTNYMSQLRGANNSEYRRIERENNARAMRKKRLENPVYRENERRQNRSHMAEMRRDNPEYRQREHAKNRHRMALKRGLLSPTSPKASDHPITLAADPAGATPVNDNVINSIYRTLENNLQSSHISFVPYQPSSALQSDDDRHQQRFNHNKRRGEFEFLQQVDEYCRQHDTGSSSDSFSRSAGSSSSSC